MAPDLVCAMQYTDDQRYVPGDEESRELRVLSPKEENVELRCAPPRSRADYGKQEKLYVITLENFKIGEKLLADYSIKSFFQQLNVKRSYK